MYAFIVHSGNSKSEAFYADRISHNLNRQGIDSWIYGENLPFAFQSEMKKADVVIVVISEEISIRSKLREALELAFKSKKRIIPIVLGNTRDVFASIDFPLREYLLKNPVYRISRDAHRLVLSDLLEQIVSDLKELTPDMSTTEHKTIRFDLQDNWTAKELSEFLQSVNTLYTVLALPEYGYERSDKQYLQLRRATEQYPDLLTDNLDLLLAPEDRLTIKQIEIASPGFVNFEGLEKVIDKLADKIKGLYEYITIPEVRKVTGENALKKNNWNWNN